MMRDVLNDWLTRQKAIVVPLVLLIATFAMISQLGILAIWDVVVEPWVDSSAASWVRTLILLIVTIGSLFLLITISSVSIARRRFYHLTREMDTIRRSLGRLSRMQGDAEQLLMERDSDLIFADQQNKRISLLTEADTRVRSLAKRQAIYSRADDALDPMLKERYPVRPFETIERECRDSMVGLLPVRIGGNAGIITARLLVCDSDIASFNSQIDVLEGEHPKLFISTFVFGQPRNSPDSNRA